MRKAVPAVLIGLAIALGAAAAEPPLSPRTRMVAVEIDRDGARVLGSSLRDRPFRLAEDRAPLEAFVEGSPATIETTLLGPKGERIAARTRVAGLCLAHPGDAAPHVAGDTIELHRESFVVELPEIAGYDRVEIAYAVPGVAAEARRVVAVEPVEPAEPLATSGAVIWPEQMGDPEIYHLYGDAAAVSERINVVLVPDGYTYAEKSVMQDHASALVDYFRTKTPYKEHDAFLNYILVYAFSVASGTDQCDCGVVVDTAMGSRFPNDGFPCGHSGNRCLFYGGGCDTSDTSNMVAAELRAPAADKTILMVNTPRYGGCGGSRAVYSAGNGVAVEIAVHELGHSLGGLADEYGGTGCGTFAGELNTSSNSIQGAWPEWIDDIGPPVAGAQYYDACLYRPEPSCEMRSLGPPFCRVCNQQWARTIFGHPRIAPTAPVRGTSPLPGGMSVDVGFPVDFGVTTRFAAGVGVTNSIVWTVRGPGGTFITTGVESIQHTFAAPGSYTVTCEVVADTNYVKKEKYGANRELVTWPVSAIVFPVPAEVSPPASTEMLRFESSDTMTWQGPSASGSSAFNLYRNGACLAPHLPTNAGTDTEVPPDGVVWTYLVTGVSSSGEGTMGSTSAGVPRSNGAPCD